MSDVGEDEGASVSVSDGLHSQSLTLRRALHHNWTTDRHRSQPVPPDPFDGTEQGHAPPATNTIGINLGTRANQSAFNSVLYEQEDTFFFEFSQWAHVQG